MAGYIILPFLYKSGWKWDEYISAASWRNSRGQRDLVVCVVIRHGRAWTCAFHVLEGILCLDIFGRRTLKIRTPVRPYDDFSEMKFYRPRRGKDLISIRSSHSGEFIIIPPVENVSFVLQVKYFNEHTLIVANDKYFNNFGPVPVTRFDPSIHQVLVYRPSKYIFCFDTLVIKRVEKYLIKNKSTKRRKILYPPRRTELRSW